MLKNQQKKVLLFLHGLVVKWQFLIFSVESLRKEIDICNELENYDCLNPELNSLRPILKKQKVLSNIPKKDEFLIEIYKTKDLSNLFVFTLDGKFVNEGIAFLWALRLAKIETIYI